MGREMRKVPKEFGELPYETWAGYTNPYQTKECDACVHPGWDYASGYSLPSIVLQRFWYSHSQEEALETLRDFKDQEVKAKLGGYLMSVTLRSYYDRNWSRSLNQNEVDALWEQNRLHHYFEGKPTYTQVNEWASGAGFGHDAINRWVVTGHVLDALGLSDLCPKCNGKCYIYENAEHERLAEEWEPTVPTGSYYQLWSTTYDGPMSPVFDTPEDAAEYIVGSNMGPAGKDYTRDEIMHMCRVADSDGSYWEPTFVFTKDKTPPIKGEADS